MKITQIKKMIAENAAEQIRAGFMNSEVKDTLTNEDYEKFCKAEEEVAARIEKLYK